MKGNRTRAPRRRSPLSLILIPCCAALVLGAAGRCGTAAPGGQAAPTAARPITHPCLISPEELASLGRDSKERERILSACEASLHAILQPDYAGWGWRTTAGTYALGYRLLRGSDPARAEKYAKKALGMMKVLARHHNGVVPDLECVGHGGGITRFPLSMRPMPGQPFFLVRGTAKTIPVVNSANPVPLGEFSPIIKISNSADGPADYGRSDYRLLYRTTAGVFMLEWVGKDRPKPGATYYVTVAAAPFTNVPESEYTVSGSAVELKQPATEKQALLVKYLSTDYEQTGNGLGGVNSVQPDGPGYPMRSFNVGLAYAYDLLRDYPGLTPDLRAEFCEVLNRQIDWYRAAGYEREGGIGNYFIRGYLTGTFYTAYATEGDNPRTAEWMKLSRELIGVLHKALEQKLGSGYGPQGQYTNGVAEDVLTTLSLFRNVTGEDLVSELAWVKNFVPATLHGTKPDRLTFYDGGDWSDMPARPLTHGIQAFVRNLPNHPAVPYARFYLRECGQAVEGDSRDYTGELPPHHWASPYGPVFARSDWGKDAVWVSLAASPILTDHQHRDQGHVTIQRGSDYLLMTGGSYGMFGSEFANTLLFDDRGAGNISTYPPGQGWWGPNSKITKYQPSTGSVYAQADFTHAYGAAHDGVRNSVKAARRSLLYIRPEVILIHDQALTARPDVKRIFNVNFAAAPHRSKDVTTVLSGKSRLFMRTLLPAEVQTEVAELRTKTVPSPCFNYRETVSGEGSDSFLHLFQLVDSGRGEIAASALVRSKDGKLQGASVMTGGMTWVALFAAREAVVESAFEYRVESAGYQRHFLADLAPKRSYRVVIEEPDRQVMDQTFTSSEAGVLSFVARPGEASRVSVTPVPVSSRQ